METKDLIHFEIIKVLASFFSLLYESSAIRNVLILSS